ncbi:hypothetical protein HYS49_00225, partial [Candidatus Woesearchaeota archaeon]|nr:hypothetical protein [Candidatus Woesearchaeota archaeon]
METITPVSACDLLISQFRNVVEKAPSEEEIDSLEPHPQSFLRKLPFLKSSYSETRGKPQAIWESFMACSYEFERDKMAILMSLDESGFKKEAIRIRRSLESYGISFPPDCPKSLGEMKRRLKSRIEFFKNRAN